jgi:Na+/proline symporter
MNLDIGTWIGLGVIIILIILILVWARKEIKKNNGFK